MSDPSQRPPKPQEAMTFKGAVELLDSIVAEKVPKEEKKDATKSFAEESAFLDNKLKEADLEARKQDTGERKRYAICLFRLICVWLVAVVLILLLAGFKDIHWFGTFSLSDGVLLGMIGSTTATVLGLFLVVVKYLFPERK